MKIAFIPIMLLIVSGFVFAQAFTDTYPQVQDCKFTSTGQNSYFILQPGYQQTYEGIDGKQNVRLVITVLDETKVIGGIETRVVKEKELHNGQLAEVSRNFFAICKRDNSVFYFGETTDIYRNGVVVSHEGAWQQGLNGAHGGLVMPAIALLGAKYFQEVAPNVAMDRAEIVSVTDTVQTPAGTFRNCVRTRETTPLEPDSIEFKEYAPGIGLIQDETLKLVNVTTVAGPE